MSSPRDSDLNAYFPRTPLRFVLGCHRTPFRAQLKITTGLQPVQSSRALCAFHQLL